MKGREFFLQCRHESTTNTTRLLDIVLDDRRSMSVVGKRKGPNNFSLLRCRGDFPIGKDFS